ncbi:MAG TPA: 3-hydroxyacyl-CoA dehydrogenase NAD-binding domain-containing protein [Candidatus Acidoferrales bacterium]|nr:3-hydroxyacyl-CoA dehydrogenase NAD-binding domain-containing protein [Candidatus Acidoferrales bacterium]
MKNIRKAAVLGAGVMGAQIAAHLANAGISSYLFDVVPKELNDEETKKGLMLSDMEVRNRVASMGLKRALDLKPAPFFTIEKSNYITLGNFDDDLKKIGEVDWIIEVIVESLEPKRELMKKIEEFRKPGTIVSSNTSGIPISKIAEGLSDDLRKNFLGTHFFNPPRYLHLLELIPTEDTLPEVVAFMKGFAEETLGKGVVLCRDTPNFIANRIGVAAMMYILHRMVECDLTIEEVDAVTGPASGKPKSATFRTADIVGLDTLIHVATNLYEAAPEDEMRNYFKCPEFILEMQKRGWLGEKTRTGFYKRIKNEKGETEILALDRGKMEHRRRQRPSFQSIELGKNIEDVRERIRNLAYSKDRAGEFFWDTTAALLIYSANRIPEIADNIVSVDDAMKWGFGWSLGPFEMWDAIGLEKSIQRMKAEGRLVPAKVLDMLAGGADSFYKEENGAILFYDFVSKGYRQVPISRKFVNLAIEKRNGKIIRENSGASLVDLGDSVACIEFHSKANSIGEDVSQIVDLGLKKLETDYDALVIANQGKYFSAGANLMLLLMMAQEGEFDELDRAIRMFQSMDMRIKYAPKPVVVAPFNMTLGGGTEMVLHAPRVRASAETYMGLVEIGVGVIPAGGGTKEMLARSLARAPRVPDADLMPFVREVLETIGQAKVSASADDAKNLGYLRPTDDISMNEKFLIHDAKSTALAMVQEGYRPPERQKIIALGQSVLSGLTLGLYLWKEAGRITDYEFNIGKKLAYVLCGGDFTSPQEVDEEYFLGLEREAFLSLCGERKTQERMQYMLKNNKALRN